MSLVLRCSLAGLFTLALSTGAASQDVPHPTTPEYLEPPASGAVSGRYDCNGLPAVLELRWGSGRVEVTGLQVGDRVVSASDLSRVNGSLAGLRFYESFHFACDGDRVISLSVIGRTDPLRLSHGKTRRSAQWVHGTLTLEGETLTP